MWNKCDNFIVWHTPRKRPFYADFTLTARHLRLIAVKTLIHFLVSLNSQFSRLRNVMLFRFHRPQQNKNLMEWTILYDYLIFFFGCFVKSTIDEENAFINKINAAHITHCWLTFYRFTPLLNVFFCFVPFATDKWLLAMVSVKTERKRFTFPWIRL